MAFGHRRAGDRRAARRRTDLRRAAATAAAVVDSPVLAAFARYLASRTDLTGGLTAEPPPPPGGDPVEAAELARETGVAVDPVPVENGPFRRCYRGRFPGGGAAVVKTSRPAGTAVAELDLELLADLAALVRPPGVGDAALRAAVEDFRFLARARADLAHEVELIAAAAEDAGPLGPCRPPAVEANRGGADVLVVRRGAGSDLPQVLAEAGRRDRPRTAIRVVTAWVWQVFACRAFAAEFAAADVTVLADGAVEIDGLYAETAAATRAELWEYLTAVAAEDHDRAADRLIRLLASGPGAVPPDQLRLRVRQAVPFRDGGTGTDDLGDLLWTYWRVAQGCGYQLPPGVLRFHRAALALRAAVAGAESELDVLRCAVENVRVIGGLAGLRAATKPAAVWDAVGHLAPLLAELPRRFDDAMAALRESAAPPPPRAADRPQGSGVLLPGLVVLGVLAMNTAGPGRAADLLLYAALAVLVWNLVGRFDGSD